MKKQVLFFFFISIFSISFALLFIKDRYIKDQSIPKAPVDKEVLDYFNKITFGFEYEDEISEQPNYALKKWEKNVVSISLNGNKINPYLGDCLENVINDFNALSNTTKLVLGDKADIDFYLLPIEKFPSIVSDYVSGNDGYFYIEFNEDNETYHSIILINSNDQSRDVERCHLIREELTQSMGLPIDSDKYEDSIFYAKWTNTLSYSPLDEKVIKLLYSGKLKSGMNINQVNNHFIAQ